jgi:hypothetical protein
MNCTSQRIAKLSSKESGGTSQIHQDVIDSGDAQIIPTRGVDAWTNTP